MASKQPPPLTPADCIYLGKGLDGLDVLRWESQSRGYIWHHTYGTLDGARDCTCEWRQNNPGQACKHMRGFVDALRHHLGDPPPADPGGAALTAAQADVAGEINDWILGGKLSPPPWLVAPGDRKRRHDEAMIDLYGG
jgi:hypothetical protein